MVIKRVFFFLGVALVALLPTGVVAQTNERPPAQHAESVTKDGAKGEKSETKGENKGEAGGDAKREGEGATGKENGEEVAQLKTRVEQLQSLVEQQQRILATMQKRLDEMDGKVQAATTSVSMTPPASPVPTLAAALGSPPRIGIPTAAGNAASPPPADATPQNVASQAGITATPQQQQQNRRNEARERTIGVAGWDNVSAYIRSANGEFQTRISGFGQLDFRGYQAGDHPPNTYLIRRARMRTDVRLKRYYDVRVEAELTDSASSVLRDFYLRIDRFEALQFTFGQIREPFSQEELRPEPNQDFVERSMTSMLVPGRSPGVMLSGRLFRGIFGYEVGSFNGKGPLRDNNNGTPESVVRLQVSPWRTGNDFWLRGLTFGGAYAYGNTDGGLSVRGQTTSRSYQFFAPDTINGKILRANGEVTWMLGPASFRAEYLQTNQFRNGLGEGGANLPGVVAKSYVAQFTYLLTGENKPRMGPTAPEHDIFNSEPGAPSFGAWELKARVDSLQISNATSKANRAETFYFGVNWYLNRFVRYIFDVGVERFNDPLRSPKPGDKNYLVTLSRVQVTF